MKEKTRKMVIGDLHGGYLALLDLLKICEFSKNDTLIFLGDYVDGWSDSDHLIDFLIDLKHNNTCIFLRGNHDQLFLDWLLTKKSNPLWLKHGGQNTIDVYKNVSDAVIQKHIQFLTKLEMYHLDANNRLFVHAGFTNPNGIESEYFSKMFFWDRTLWETALALDPTMLPTSPYYPKRFNLYSEIYIGHTPVTRIDYTIPINKACVWNLDTGAAYKGPLTIMDIDTKQYWQSKPVCDYYPNENGRN